LPKKEQNPVEPLRAPLLSSPLCGERDERGWLRLKTKRYSLATIAAFMLRLQPKPIV
jgi:hypothetical protein